MQHETTVVDAFSDANWAGCRRTRKSTSGGALLIGTHLIKTYAKTQATIAKSSAESELYGIVRTTCESLGLITLMEDLGAEGTVRLHMDATAAQGVIDRHGISKIRHLDVNVLWIQEQLAREYAPISKVLGTENGADLMTKNVGADLIAKHCARLSLEFREGRSAKAAGLQCLDRRDSDLAVPLSPVFAHPPVGVLLGGKIGGRTISEGLAGLVSPEETGVERTHRVERAAERMIAACEQYSSNNKGDQWHVRGAGGSWVRLHNTPRRSLFTPCRVPRGPARPDLLSQVRRTLGTDANGQSFIIEDDWKCADDAHRVLDLPWTGVTTFCDYIGNRRHEAGMR